MNMFKRLTAYITFTSKSNETIFASNENAVFFTKAFGRIQLRVSNPSMMFSMKDNIERITIRKRKYFHTYKDLRADSASRKQSINDVLYVKQNIERTTIRKRKYSHKKFMI